MTISILPGAIFGGKILNSNPTRAFTKSDSPTDLKISGLGNLTTQYLTPYRPIHLYSITVLHSCEDGLKEGKLDIKFKTYRFVEDLILHQEGNYYVKNDPSLINLSDFSFMGR